jgi:hypothetical protein
VCPYGDQWQDWLDGADEAAEKLAGGLICHTGSLRQTMGPVSFL